jgi:hypothetical protein
MDARLKNFAIRQFEGLPEKNKQDFLTMAESAPDWAIKILSSCVVLWGKALSNSIGQMIIINNLNEDAHEILEDFQKRFTAKPAAITE